MRVNLSNTEIELIEKALDTYEREASSEALMGSMLGMMLTPKDQRDEEKLRFKAEMEKAEEEMRHRRRVSTLLRAKLYQASALESEHVIET